METQLSFLGGEERYPGDLCFDQAPEQHALKLHEVANAVWKSGEKAMHWQIMLPFADPTDRSCCHSTSWSSGSGWTISSIYNF